MIKNSDKRILQATQEQKKVNFILFHSYINDEGILKWLKSGNLGKKGGKWKRSETNHRPDCARAVAIILSNQNIQKDQKN